MSLPDIDPRKIKWIAFDAVGTLIHPDPPVGAAYHQVGVRHGSRLARDEVTARFREAFVRVAEAEDLICSCAETRDSFHTCDDRERLRWRRIVSAVLDDVTTPEACFEELFTHFARPDSWAVYPDVGSALRRLRDAGYRLAICSNFDGRLNAVMEGLPELAPIELRIISSEVRYRKPSPRIFEALACAAGCQASEVLFVGDDAAIDVAAAEAAGLSALQIDRSYASGQNRTLRSLDELVARLT
jgi:putative hydrolase of the HAD superfamily